MTTARLLLASFIASAVLLLIACDRGPGPASNVSVETPRVTIAVAEPDPVEPTTHAPIVIAARNQIGRTVIYDPAYVGLKYPGGDVPIERGVCTDVVIRAMRDAHDMDLQQLVHEDMKANFSAYPKIWRLTKPDRNIDHRRVPNLQTYFERRGYALPATSNAADYLPGDIVTCTVGRNLAHIMIVSDRTSNDNVPLVIHNIGSGAKEENRLFEFALTGHYRIDIPPAEPITLQR